MALHKITNKEAARAINASEQTIRCWRQGTKKMRGCSWWALNARFLGIDIDVEAKSEIPRIVLVGESLKTVDTTAE